MIKALNDQKLLRDKVKQRTCSQEKAQQTALDGLLTIL